MTELLQGFEDLFAIVLHRLLLGLLLPLAPARCRNFLLHFSRFLFPQVVQHGDFQLRSSHATSNRSDGSCRHASGMNELPTDQVIHRECGCVHSELHEVLGLALNVYAQTKVLNTFADGFYQSLDDRTLHAAPIRDLVYDGLAMLTQHLLGGSHALISLAGDIEDVRQVGIQRKFLHRNLLRQAETIELADRRFHLIDGNVGAATTPGGFDISDFSRHAIDVLELGQRAPTVVALSPLGARREPDRKRFRKIFIRMLLRVPPSHVANKLPRERYGTVIIAICAPKRTEEIAPLSRLV